MKAISKYPEYSSQVTHLFRRMRRKMVIGLKTQLHGSVFESRVETLVASRSPVAVENLETA